MSFLRRSNGARASSEPRFNNEAALLSEPKIQSMRPRSSASRRFNQ